MIYLRKIESNDSNNIIRWRNNHRVRKMFLDQRELTLEMHTEWLERHIKTGKSIQFIIVNQDEDKDIGSIFIKNIDNETRTGEYGIFIGEDDQRGKGHAKNASQMIINFAFNDLKLKNLFLRVLSTNISAIHMYEKLGFYLDHNRVEEVEIDGILQKVLFMNKENGEHE